MMRLVQRQEETKLKLSGPTTDREMEREIAARLAPAPVIESAGDAAVTTAIVDDTLAWNDWPDPDVLDTNINEVRVEVDEPDPSVGINGGLVLIDHCGDELGEVNNFNGLRQLGWAASFPADFVDKLSPRVAAEVINERLAAVNGNVTLVFERGELTNLIKGGRGVPTYRQVASKVHDTLENIYGEQVKTIFAHCAGGEMRLRFVTGVEQAVTRAVGDVLQMGIEVHQNYGADLSLSLYVQRLVCLNGMTARHNEFSWRVRDCTTVDHQLAWLATSVGEVTGAFDRIVAKSREMAQIAVSGDINEVLTRYARSMRFPQRYLGRVLDAYEQEPIPTQWGVLNAFTRAATHSLSGVAQHSILAATGDWVSNFDYVNCRLPRPVAISSGAELIEA
jgi:hypothetical protein